MRRREAEVARQRLLEPARDAVAVDGRDHGFPDLESARDSAETVIVVGDRVVSTAPRERRRDHLLQIGTGREGLLARAGEDRDPGRVVVAKPRPGFDERLVSLRIDGVHRLGPVHRDGHDPVLLLVQHGRHPHPSSLRRLPAARPHQTKRAETEPSRVYVARMLSPGFGRSSADTEPDITTSPARSPSSRAPRWLATHARELAGLPSTSAAVLVAAMAPFIS